MVLSSRLAVRQAIHLQFRAFSKNDFRDKIKYGSDYIQPRSRPRMFLTRKFLQFVEKYESLMKKHAPTAFELYSSLSTGTKLLYRDIQTYMGVSKELANGKKPSDLTRKQLEAYYKVPKDIVHVAPTLIIAVLPLTNYVIFPLLYGFPRVFLSSQFWTDKQSRYIEVERHLKKVQYHDAVLWHFKRGRVADEQLKANSLTLIEKLRNGGQAAVPEILNLKPLFQDGGSFALHNISYGHLRSLSLSQGIRLGGFMPYGKLWKFGGFLWEMDRALSRENIKLLTQLDLIQCCFWRGFNPIGVPRAEAEDYLRRWLQLSLDLKDGELSLLLHAPIFLAYNHRNNFGVNLL